MLEYEFINYGCWKIPKGIIFRVEFVYSFSISSLDDWKLLGNYRKKYLFTLSSFDQNIFKIDNISL